MDLPRSATLQRHRGQHTPCAAGAGLLVVGDLSPSITKPPQPVSDLIQSPVRFYPSLEFVSLDVEVGEGSGHTQGNVVPLDVLEILDDRVIPEPIAKTLDESAHGSLALRHEDVPEFHKEAPQLVNLAHGSDLRHFQQLLQSIEIRGRGLRHKATCMREMDIRLGFDAGEVKRRVIIVAG